MRNTIAANFSKQPFKNFKKYWPCAVANPGRNQRVGSKLISWASGLNSFLGRNQVGFSKAAINLQSQIASQLSISQNNIYCSVSFFAEYEILIQIFVSLQGNNNKLLILLPKLVHILKDYKCEGVQYIRVFRNYFSLYFVWLCSTRKK